MAWRSFTAAAAMAAGVALAGVMIAAPIEQPKAATRPATNPATRPVDRMVEVATRRMERLDLLLKRGEVDLRELYSWSKRLMKAQREAAADAAGRRAAVEAHRDRMAQHLEGAKAIPRAGVGAAAGAQGVARLTHLTVQSFEFYVADAEHLLAKMDAKEEKQ